MELENKDNAIQENKEYKAFFERIVGYLQKHGIEAKAYAYSSASGFETKWGIGIHRDAFPESFVKSEEDQEIYVSISSMTIIPLGKLVHEFGHHKSEDTWRDECLKEWQKPGLKIAAKAIAKAIQKYLEKSSEKCVDNPGYCPKYEKGRDLGRIVEKYVRKKSGKYAEKALEKYNKKHNKEDDGLDR